MKESSKHLVRAIMLVLALIVTTVLGNPATAYAGQRQTENTGQAENVALSSDGAIQLLPSAPPAPRSYGQYKRFGTYVSPAQPFSSFFVSLQIDYTVTSPNGALALVDVRASADGERWTEWNIDLTPGAIATFNTPSRFAQYRVTLLSNKGTPTVRDINLTPQAETTFTAMDAPVAPTFKVHATRMGMVGGRTANGHIIKKRDHYVSLPSRRSLSSRGGSEYMVRITYKGRTSVAPVYDIGPWNIRDDYWNAERERYNDLPRGYPQDHAAYFDGHNKGRAEKGKVSFPTAIDIGDGVWWDDLGIKGDRAVVEVTFLWLGTDPLAGQAVAPPVEVAPQPAPVEAAPAAPPVEAAPQPAEPAPPATPSEITVDNSSGSFKKLQAKVWYNGPDGCGTTGHAHWTYTTQNADDGENIARWQPGLAADSLYDVFVYIPDCAAKKARTNSAHYIISHRDGQAEVVINQEAHGGTWVSIGRYPFAAGDAGFVELRDITDDSMQVLWYDAIKWVPVQ